MKEIQNKDEYRNIIKNNESSGKLIVMKWNTDDCVPCTKLAPFLEEIETQQKGAVLVYNIDCEEFDDLFEEEEGMGVPYMVFYQNDRRLEALSTGNPQLIQSAIFKYITDASDSDSE